MSSSQVEVTVGGANVTNHAIYSRMGFDAQQNGQPGTLQLTLRDLDRTLGPFTTGDEVIVEVDSIRLFGGFLRQVSETFALPADKLPTDTRLWVLRATDYNTLFDWRITRNLSNLLQWTPIIYGDVYAGEAIQDLCANYLDLPAGLDYTTHVDDIRRLMDLEGGSPPYTASSFWTWKQQGTKWREQMEMVAEWSAGLWYIDADMKLHHHAVEDSVAPFGFSDDPDGVTTIGMRDVSATEDASFMVNDAFVWGGSEWTNGTVIGRSTNEDSVDEHGLWQTSEWHFGEEAYRVNTQWRADQIVEGSEELRSAGFNPGLAYAQWSVTLSWFGENVPSNQHIQAGQIVPIYLTSFGAPLNPILLPMRSVSVDFVGVDDSGKGHVKFTGHFGLQLSDPFSVWAYLLKLQRQASPVIAAATNSTPGASYGSLGQFEPDSLGGGVYELPNDFSYVPSTTQVYVDGVLQQRDTDYTESDPVAGEITFSGGDPSGWIWIVCRTA